MVQDILLSSNLFEIYPVWVSLLDEVGVAARWLVEKTQGKRRNSCLESVGKNMEGHHEICASHRENNESQDATNEHALYVLLLLSWVVFLPFIFVK